MAIADHRHAIALAAAAAMMAAGLPAAAQNAFRVDHSEAGQMLVVGSYPRARSCLWSPGAGPFKATTTVDLAAPYLSLDDVLGVERLLKDRVRVRVLAYVDPTGSDERAAAREIALRRLAREGAEVYRTEQEAARAGFAVADGRRVFVPSPFRDEGPSHAFAAEADQRALAREFEKHFEAMIETGRRSEVTGPGAEPTAQQIWPGVDPEEGKKTLCGTTGTDGRPPYGADIYPIFGLEDALGVLDRVAAPPGSAAAEANAILTLYIGTDEFRDGRSTEILPKLLEPVIREWTGRIGSVTAVVDPAVDKDALEAWIRGSFPKASATLVRETLPVQSGFTLRIDPGSTAGFAFLGSPDAGLVVVGWTPVSERFDLKKRP